MKREMQLRLKEQRIHMRFFELLRSESEMRQKVQESEVSIKKENTTKAIHSNNSK